MIRWSFQFPHGWVPVDASAIPSESASSISCVRRSATREENERRRPEEVELLLRRERPEVVQRRQRVRAAESEDHVRGVCARDGDHGDGVHSECAGDRLRGEEHRDESEESREEAQAAPEVEPAKRDAAVRALFVQQQRRDQESAEHEEQVDSEEPVGRKCEGMEADDGRDRNPAEPIERRLIAEAAHTTTLRPDES